MIAVPCHLPKSRFAKEIRGGGLVARNTISTFADPCVCLFENRFHHQFYDHARIERPERLTNRYDAEDSKIVEDKGWFPLIAKSDLCDLRACRMDS